MTRPPTETPRQLGPYRLLERIGRGGMAEVYRAVVYGASGFEKEVAIKVLRPDLRGQGRLERMLIEEARLGARLEHANLVGVHDLGLDQGLYYVRMDLVRGADLRVLCKLQRPSAELAVYIAREVSAALACIHAARDARDRPLGLVHRDLSPSNVLLGEDGVVKLSDLGIAKPTHQADRSWGEVLKGKYAYMSPEQLLDRPLSPHSDHFSLATMLYELLRGARPFDGDTTFETMDAIRRAEAPDMRGIPRRVRAVLLRCFQPEPEARYASTEALVDALHALCPDPRALRAQLAAWVRATQSNQGFSG